jgi:uncharacterized protein (TIGR02217 family)
VTVNGGFEQRNKNWSQARGRFQVGNRTVSEVEFQVIKEFFTARNGKFQGFRLRDWSDFRDNGRGILGDTGLATHNVSQYQMNKKYASGSDSYIRKIAKPVSGTVAIKVDAATWTAGTSIDYTTGLVTFSPFTKAITAITNAQNAEVTTGVAHTLTTGNKVLLSGIAGITQLNGQYVTATVVNTTKFTTGIDTRVGIITGITKAAQAVVSTSNAHGYQAGDTVNLTGVLGMTQINGLSTTVASVTTNSLTLNVNSTAFSTYTSGGKVKKSTQSQYYDLYVSGGTVSIYPQDGAAITWTGEFDVPVRFDTDEFTAEVVSVVHPTNAITSGSTPYMQLGNIPIVEIRV